MLIPFSSRVAAHLLRYGYAADTERGEPLRHLGRGTLRVTAQFPEACTAHALPGRLAAHVGGLPMALEPTGTEQSALLILPAYHETGGGRLAAAHVTLLRVLLDPRQESRERPGDSVHSCALVLDGATYGASAPAFVAEAGKFLDVSPVWDDLPETERIGISRPVFAPTVRPIRRVADLCPTARRVLAAIRVGETIHLGPGDCRDEAEFLSVLADVLDVLPPELRPHLSAASGLSLPDRAFQVAWGRTLPSYDGSCSDDAFRGIDPATTLSDAGRRLFSGSSAGATAGFSIPEGCRYAGAVISTRDEPGVMPQIRAYLARCAAGDHAETDARGRSDIDDASGVMHALEALGRDQFSSTSARALLTFLIAASRVERDALSEAAHRIGSPAFATVTDILCETRRTPIDLSGLDLVLRLADFAEGIPGGKAYAGGLVSQVQVRLTAFLAARMLLSESALRTIVGSRHLLAATAVVLAREDGVLTSRVLDAIAVVELLGPAGRQLASRARHALTPRDERACQIWRTRGADINDLKRALAIFTSSQPLPDRDFAHDVSSLAARLIEAGRRDILVDAMRTSAMQLDAVERSSSHQDAAVEERRLDVIVALGRALRQAPSAPRTIIPIRDDREGLSIGATA